MRHPYLHYVEKLRQSLVCESKLYKVADSFMDITEQTDFVDNSYTLTDDEMQQYVSPLIPAIQQMLAATPPTSNSSKNRLSVKKTTPFKVKRILKVDDCDLFHGWGSHKRCCIVFFFFGQKRMGLAIRTQPDSILTDFFRFRVPCTG